MAMALPFRNSVNYPTFSLDFDNDVLSQCSYVHVTDIPDMTPENKFSILSVNIRSCRRNFLEFISVFNGYLCRFTCISSARIFAM